MARSLEHIRVLDLSRVLAGPFCGQTLADLGADVIKVERPGEGDDTRRWGPPFLTDRSGKTTEESAYFMSANRGKRSITVDVSTPEGQEIIRSLAKQSDVVIENYKVGGLAKYGLDYPSLAALKPDLIYCSITGFGQNGPYSHLPGYDLLVQGMGGLMSITGEAGREPMKTGVAVTDLFTGLYATIAILAALTHRDRTGTGQHIDLGLLDVTVAMLAYQANNYLVGNTVTSRNGNAHPSIVPYQVFATADGHLILAVGNDTQFSAFCRGAGCSDLAVDSRFSTNTRRVENRDFLIPILNEIFKQKQTHEWVKMLDSCGVPAGPINNIDEAFANPQTIHRQMAVPLPHPFSDTLRVVGNPIRLSETPIQYDQSPPLLGEHTTEVLSDVLGLPSNQIEHLRSKGVI